MSSGWKLEDFSRFIPQQGFIRDYLAYAIKCTDAPPLYHILSATAVVSAAIAPYTDLIHQGEVHPLHIYVLLIGDSSESRKTSAIKRCTRVADPLFEKMSRDRPRLWWAAVSSPEGLIEELSKEPNRLLLLSEWTEMNRLTHAGYWKHSPEMFNLLYDACDVYRARSKESKTVLKRPRVSILGASTKTLVEAATNPVDWHGGKLARYIIGCAYRPSNFYMDAASDFPEDVEALRGQLGALLTPSTAGLITLSPEAWQVMRAWIRDPWWRDLKARASPHLKPSFGRFQEHLFRIAAIFEATLSYPFRTVVSAESMVAAQHLIEWCAEELVRNFALVYENDMTGLARVVNLLASHGAEGVVRSTLLRESRLTARQLNDIIFTLQERGEIGEVTADTGGRSATLYKYIRPRE